MWSITKKQLTTKNNYLCSAQIIAVGSKPLGDIAGNRKIEIYGEKAGNWTDLGNYPAGDHFNAKNDRMYYGHASVYYNGAFFIFSGYPWTDIIGKIDAVTHEWSIAGKINVERISHRVIMDGSVFLVIGGNNGGDVCRTENCVFDGAVMTCSLQESSPLDNYKRNPKVFLTTDNYSEDCFD